VRLHVACCCLRLLFTRILTQKTNMVSKIDNNNNEYFFFMFVLCRRHIIHLTISFMRKGEVIDLTRRRPLCSLSPSRNKIRQSRQPSTFAE